MPPYHPLSIHTNFSWINAEAIQQKKQKTIKEVNVSHVTTTTIITRSFPLTLSVPPNVIPSHHSLHSSHCTNNTSTTSIHTSIVQTFEIKSHRMNTRWENVRAGRTFKRTNSVAWNCHLNHTHAQTLSHIYEWAHTHSQIVILAVLKCILDMATCVYLSCILSKRMSLCVWERSCVRLCVRTYVFVAKWTSWSISSTYLLVLNSGSQSMKSKTQT